MFASLIPLDVLTVADAADIAAKLADGALVVVTRIGDAGGLDVLHDDTPRTLHFDGATLRIEPDAMCNGRDGYPAIDRLNREFADATLRGRYAIGIYA